VVQGDIEVVDNCDDGRVGVRRLADIELACANNRNESESEKTMQREHDINRAGSHVADDAKQSAAK
jgi:hypothetical protein